MCWPSQANIKILHYHWKASLSFGIAFVRKKNKLIDNHIINYKLLNRWEF